MNKTRILVIDDNIAATRIVKLSLERTGRYEVCELNNPFEALPVTREFKPDLILLDVSMPGIEGGDVAFRIHSEKEFERTPIVFLTALVSPVEAKGTGMLVGGFHFVAKPPRLEQMIACIEDHLERVRSSDEPCTIKES